MLSAPTTPRRRQPSLKRELTLHDVSRLFLLQDFGRARDACDRLLQSARPDDLDEHTYLYSLHVQISGETGQFETVWRDVVDIYGGIGSLPSELLVVGLLIMVKEERFTQGRNAFEQWVASQADAYFASLKDPLSNGLTQYERLVELYSLHILPGLKDWDAAFGFLETNDFLDAERRQLYMEHLDALYNEATAVVEESEEDVFEDSSERPMDDSGIPLMETIEQHRRASFESPNPPEVTQPVTKTSPGGVKGKAKPPKSPFQKLLKRLVARSGHIGAVLLVLILVFALRKYGVKRFLDTLKLAINWNMV